MDAAAEVRVSKRQTCTEERKETCIAASVLLFDIEGTTTSISFVKVRLFEWLTVRLHLYFLRPVMRHICQHCVHNTPLGAFACKTSGVLVMCWTIL